MQLTCFLYFSQRERGKGQDRRNRKGAWKGSKEVNLYIKVIKLTKCFDFFFTFQLKFVSAVCSYFSNNQ